MHPNNFLLSFKKKISLETSHKIDAQPLLGGTSVFWFCGGFCGCFSNEIFVSLLVLHFGEQDALRLLHLLPPWQNLFRLSCIFLIEALNFSLFSCGFCSFVSIYSVSQDGLGGFLLSLTIPAESSVHLSSQLCAGPFVSLCH